VYVTETGWWPIVVFVVTDGRGGGHLAVDAAHYNK
jgi:hypothetical protein